MKKRLMSLILATMMVFSLMSTSAFAVATKATFEEAYATNDQSSALDKENIGDILPISMDDEDCPRPNVLADPLNLAECLPEKNELALTQTLAELPYTGIEVSEAVDVAMPLSDNQPPIAGLKYLILNSDSLLDGLITTQTQIAWLWSYNGEDFSYDPDGDEISHNLDGISSSDIVGFLSGDIGFVTQFSTPAQYIMSYQVEDEYGAKSNVVTYTINVESPDGRARPSCVLGATTLTPHANEVMAIQYGTTDVDGDPTVNVRGTVIDPAGVQHPFTDYVVDINGNLQLDASVAYLRFPAEGDYNFSISVQDKYGAWSNWGRFIVQVASGRLVFSNVTITGDTGLAPVDPIPSTSACRWMDYGMTLALAKGESLTPDEIWLFSTSFTPPNGLSGHYLGHYFIISGYLKYADGTPKANTTVDIEIPLTNTLYYSLPNSTFRATAVTNSNGYFSYKCGSITEYFNKLGYSSVSLTSGIGTFSNSAFVGSLNSMAFIVDTDLYLSTSAGGSYSCPVMGTVGYWPQAMMGGHYIYMEDFGVWEWFEFFPNV